MHTVLVSNEYSRQGGSGDVSVCDGLLLTVVHEVEALRLVVADADPDGPGSRHCL